MLRAASLELTEPGPLCFAPAPRNRRAGTIPRAVFLSVVCFVYAYGTGFGCCCLIFSMYFWKNHFWMSIMFSSRPWMYA